MCSTIFLQGCDSIADTQEDERTQSRITRAAPVAKADKFRHKELLNRAITPNRDPGKSESNILNLIFSIDPQKVLDRFKILDRFKVLDRFRVLDRFEFEEVFDGFAISVEDLDGLNDFTEFITELQNDPDVIWFEPDISVSTPTPGGVTASSSQQVPWSVAAIGGQDSWTKSGDGQGSVNVDVYILDTGVALANNNDPNDDLALVENIDFRPNSNDSKDIDGHGTHIAGIVGAIDNYHTMVGIAPGAFIHNYKVLDDNGSTDVSVVISAVEHILKQKLTNPSTPMVVNMSLGENIGSSEYTALDLAIQEATNAGVVFVVAAGNHGIDAQNVTPAHTAEVITVGSHDVNGIFSDFSNYGAVIDILAPGESVLSLVPSGGLTHMDGTSMATAHVTGAAALYLAQNPSASPETVRNALVNSAKTLGIGAPTGTTKRSVWVGPAASSGNGGTNEIAVSSALGDIEQNYYSGYMYNGYNDLYLGGGNGSSNWLTGLHFNNAGIPKNATITNAYVQFKAYGTSYDYTSLNIRAHDTDNAPSFSMSSNNLKSRPTTSSAVSWNPASWNIPSEAGSRQRTPDLSAVIQELVNRPGWSSNNDIALIFSGSGWRSAYAYEAGASKAPKLHVEWQ